MGLDVLLRLFFPDMTPLFWISAMAWGAILFVLTLTPQGRGWYLRNIKRAGPEEMAKFDEQVKDWRRRRAESAKYRKKDWMMEKKRE